MNSLCKIPGRDKGLVQDYGLSRRGEQFCGMSCNASRAFEIVEQAAEDADNLGENEYDISRGFAEASYHYHDLDVHDISTR